MLCSWRGEHFERMLVKGSFQVEGVRPMVLRHSTFKKAAGDSGLKICCLRATFCLSCAQGPPTKMPISKTDFLNISFTKHKLSEGSDQAFIALLPRYHKDGKGG